MSGDVVVVQVCEHQRGELRTRSCLKVHISNWGASQILMAVGRATKLTAGTPCNKDALQPNDGTWSVHLIRHFNPDRGTATDLMLEGTHT